LLDEATSALDERAEDKLYRLLLERLPRAAIVSIGHRSSLIAFHKRFLELRPDAAGGHSLAPVTRGDSAGARDEMAPSLV
jgi:vitamin B12/bleomycin/antimicrobial peptide transport system ATP-binding/permease protein